jgi:hypothetical protein
MIANTFSGPWLVRASFVIGIQSFVIAGSADANGRSELRFPMDTPQLVQGDEWTIQLDTRVAGAWTPGVSAPPSPDGGAYRRTFFDPARGLVVQLATGSVRWLTMGSDLFIPGIEVTCVCQDPDTMPPASGPLPSFTIPHPSTRERS